MQLCNVGRRRAWPNGEKSTMIECRRMDPSWRYFIVVVVQWSRHEHEIQQQAKPGLEWTVDYPSHGSSGRGRAVEFHDPFLLQPYSINNM